MATHTSRILDQSGQPFKLREIEEPQTARLGHLHQEFASHPVRGLTPGRLARILEEAEQGDLRAQCDLFEDMEEKDGHIFAELGKRKRALLGLDWDIVPPRNASKQEEEDAAWARELIQDLPNFEDILLDMGDAIGKGFANLEIEWQRTGSEWLPDIQYRPPSWFKVQPDNRNELRLRDNTMAGAALRPFNWISHIHKAKSGYITRAGLSRVLAWPFLFKNYSVRDLAEFLEIYGLPLRLGTYPSGASDDEKATLLSAVVNIGHAAAGIIPEGMMIDFKESAKGNKDPYEAMMGWCERTQSKAILGGTLTSQADGASSTNALGNVHNEVRHDLMAADARQFGSTLTRDLVYPVLALNRTGITSLRRCPRFVFDTQEPEDMALIADAVPKLVDVGMRIPVEWIHEKLRIPEAEDDDEVLSRAVPIPAALKSGLAALKAHTDKGDVADAYTAQLDASTQAALAGLIDPVAELVMEADSLEDIRDGIVALSAQLDESTLATQMQLAFAAVDLAGRFEVQNGQ